MKFLGALQLGDNYLIRMSLDKDFKLQSQTFFRPHRNLQTTTFLFLEITSLVSTQAGQVDDKLIKFNTSYPIPTNTAVYLTFPTWYDSNQIQTQSMVDETQLNALNVDYTPLKFEFNSTNQTVKLLDLIRQNYSKGGQLQFILKGIKNPISTSVSRQMSLKTIHNNGMTVDTGTLSIKASTFAILHYNILNIQDKTVQTRVDYYILFNVTFPVKNSCNIQLDFPLSDFDFQTDGIQGVQTGGAMGITQAATYVISQNRISITNGCRLDFLPSATNLAMIKVLGVKNPKIVKQTDSITMIMTDQANGLIVQTDSSTNQLNFIPTYGFICLGLIRVLDSSMINSLTSFEIQFQTSHSFTSNFQIEISISDTDYKFQSETGISIVSSNVDNINSATLVATNQKITIQGFTSSINPGTLYKIVFNSIMLGQSTKPLNQIQFNISEIYPVGASGVQAIYYGVDNGVFQQDFIIPAAGNFTYLKVQSLSSRAVDITKYTFQIATWNSIPMYGCFLIYLPPELTVPSNAVTCTDGTNSLSCSFSSGLQAVNITGFTLNSKSPAQTILTIVVSNIQNPRSLTTTQSFRFVSFDQNGYLVDTSDNTQASLALTEITMSLPSLLKNAKVTPSSLIVGVKNVTYIFQFTTPSYLISGDQMQIVIPTDVDIPEIYSCTSNAIQGDIQYSRIDINTIIISMNFAGDRLDSSKILDLKIKGFNNKGTGTPSSNFNIYLKESNGVEISQHDSQNFNVQMTKPHIITSGFNFSNYPQSPRQLQLVTINFTTVQKIPLNAKIIITYPPILKKSYDILTILIITPFYNRVGQIQLNAGANYFTATDIFPLEIPENLLIQLLITGFTNTDTIGFGDTFQLDIHTSDDYVIDRIENDLKMYVKCNFPCASCNLDLGPTYCTECLPKTSYTPYNVLQKQQCLQSCYDGYFQNNSDPNFPVCNTCSSNCLTCNGTSTNCTSCQKYSNVTALFNNICQSSCPGGYFQNTTNGQCQACSSNCLNCSGTADTCTYCANYTYLTKGKCNQFCPTGTTIANNTNWTCADCDIRCKTCQNVTGQCTSCKEGLRLNPFNKVCDKYCPEQITVEETKGFCEECNIDCLTCQDYKNKCTSCQPGLIPTLDNQCLNKCQAGTILYQGLCTWCNSECNTCQKVPQFCTSCRLGYLFHQNTCLLKCPQGMDANYDTGLCILRSCPEGYRLDEIDGKTCIMNCTDSETHNHFFDECWEDPVFIPFPILIFLASITIVLIIFVKAKRYISTNLLQTIICLWSLFEIPIFAVQVAFCALYQYWVPCALTAAAIFMIYVTNCTSTLYFNKLRKEDPIFINWSEEIHYFQYKKIIRISILYNQKLLRLLTCGFCDYKCFQADFQNLYVFFVSHLKRYIYRCIFLIYSLIVAADIIILLTIEWSYYLYIIAIETLVFAVLITIMQYVDYRLMRNQFTFQVKVTPKGMIDTVADQEDDNNGPAQDDLKQYQAHIQGNDKLSLLSQLQRLQEAENASLMHKEVYNSDRSQQQKIREKLTEDYKTNEIKLDSNQSKNSDRKKIHKEKYNDFETLPPINLDRQKLQFYDIDPEESDYIQESPDPHIEVLHNLSEDEDEFNKMDSSHMIIDNKDGQDFKSALKSRYTKQNLNENREKTQSTMDYTNQRSEIENEELKVRTPAKNTHKLPINQIEQSTPKLFEQKQSPMQIEQVLGTNQSDTKKSNEKEQQDTDQEKPLNFQPPIQQPPVIEDTINDDSVLQIQFQAKKRVIKKRGNNKNKAEEKQQLIDQNQDNDSSKIVEIKSNNFLD